MVFIGKTSARPAQHRHLDLPERGDDIIADAARIGDRAVLAHPDALVDAAAEVFRELAVDVAVDRVAPLVGMDDQFALRRRRGVAG